MRKKEKDREYKQAEVKINFLGEMLIIQALPQKS